MVSTNVYATITELKARIGQVKSGEDTVLTALLTASSRMWDRFCGRYEYGFEALASATAIQFPGRGDGWVYTEENVEVTAVGYKTSVTETTYTALTSADWRAFRGSPKSRNSIRFDRVPYHGVMLTPNASISRFVDGDYSKLQGIEPTVEVTAKWGYSVLVPEEIREATIAQATIFYKRGKGAWSDVLVSGDFGEARFVRALDPALKLLVKMTGLVKPGLGVSR